MRFLPLRQFNLLVRQLLMRDLLQQVFSAAFIAIF